jgi:hypothetical protein
VTRSAGLAAGSSVGTALWTALSPSAPFLVGGTIKIAYDLTLWWMFRRIKPPEDVAGWLTEAGIPLMKHAQRSQTLE